MKKIFIDAGANKCDSIDWFLKSNSKSQDYEIYAFEPNPLFKDCFKNKPVTLINKAVWIKDEVKHFYLDSSNRNLGSTLYKSKKTGRLDKENPLEIDCIDFNLWFKSVCKKDDYIILKMDIEGAEYQVLEVMMKEGTIDYIDEFYIEFHKGKIASVSDDVHDEVVRKLNLLNIKILEWKDPPTI